MYELALLVAPYVLGAVVLIANVLATGHAILYRRNSRTTAIWAGLIWLTPSVGALLYVVLGVNRIQRKAQKLRKTKQKPLLGQAISSSCGDSEESDPFPDYMHAHVKLLDTLVHQPLTAHNRVELLHGGDEAFPAMIEAISKAERTVTLTSYIFDSDRSGRAFVEAMEEAVERDVDVRVIIDGVGQRYSHPSTLLLLHRVGVKTAAFLRPLLPWSSAYMNMRNHRKIMVVDGKIGFTGGMNIREGAVESLEPKPGHPIKDVHARIEGPAVSHLQDTFVEDWNFVTGEALEGPEWYPDLEDAGQVMARGISAGPDEDLDKMRLTLISALGVAKNRVRIITPYFIPDDSLITALNVASMHGAEVDIVLPEENNLSMVQWASTATLWQVLERGCRIWLTPLPFDHTKLVTVDGVWNLLGSCNWDPRSLRLNFEFNVECYDPQLAKDIEEVFEERRSRARQLTLEEVDSRSIPIRLRDGLARVFSPYL